MSVELAGRSPDRVLGLIGDRRQRKLRGEPLDDGHKLALIVEGGAMRGVYTAGTLFALAWWDCADIFDVAYGVSAGAVNTAYFLSGQARLAVGTYYEDLCGPEFINPRRFWKMVDVDFVEREVFTQRKPLDEKAIRTGRTQFFVGMTECATGEGVCWHLQGHPEPLSRVLKASMALPVVYNRTVDLGGRRFMDGGLANPIPIDWALADGATHCLVLLTRPRNDLMRPPGWRERTMFRFLFRDWNRHLQRTYEGRWGVYRRSLDRALAEDAQPGSAAIATILPGPDVCQIRVLTKDPSLLKLATDQMMESFRALLTSGEAVPELR